VARQYCGSLGKIANCQSVVSWQVVGDTVHFPALAQLYLPREWIEDRSRLDKAGVPLERRKFREKWKIGLELLDRIKGQVDYRALVFDAGYGEIGPLLEQLEERGEPYLAQVPRSHCYWPVDVAVILERAPPVGGRQEFPQ
jgi:SRSO17 transposase